MSGIEIPEHQVFKRLYSYKEQRIKSAKKLDLNTSLTSQNDLEEISTTIKDKISRRLSQSNSFNTFRLSLQQDAETILKGNEALRQSSVSTKFIQKYMGKNFNIEEVSEEETIKLKQTDQNIASRFSKRKIPQQKSTPLIKTLNKIQQPKPFKQSIKRKASKFQISKVVRKIQIIRQEIEKMGLGCGKEVSNDLLNVLIRLKGE